MARYRKIDVRMHGDEKFRRLSPTPPCGQALWWNLLAGKQTGIIPGLCSIGKRAFAEQLGWSLEGFMEAFQEVSQEGMAKADWEAQLVWVPNAIKYNKPESPNVIRSWKDEWDELPECDLKTQAWQGLKTFFDAFGEGFQKAFKEACPEPLLKPSRKTMANQEQEQEQEQEQDITMTTTTGDGKISDDEKPAEPEPLPEDERMTLPESLEQYVKAYSLPSPLNINAFIRETLQDLIVQYPRGKLLDAFERAAKGNARTIDYLIAVLEGKEGDRRALKNKRTETDPDELAAFLAGG